MVNFPFIQYMRPNIPNTFMKFFSCYIVYVLHNYTDCEFSIKPIYKTCEYNTFLKVFFVISWNAEQ